MRITSLILAIKRSLPVLSFAILFLGALDYSKPASGMIRFSCPISTLGRRLLEETVSKLLRDAFFVSIQSHNLDRGFALSLVGVEQAYRGVTFLTKECTGPATFEAFCEFANIPAGEPIPPFWMTHDRCLRLACEGARIDLVQVYMTMRPKTAPDDRHPFRFSTVAPAGTAVYDPNPSVVWRIDQTVAGKLVVSASISNRLIITPTTGEPINLTHAGTIVVTQSSNEILSGSLQICFSALASSSTTPTVVTFNLGTEGGTGAVSYGPQKIATISGSPSSPLVFTWEGDCAD